MSTREEILKAPIKELNEKIDEIKVNRKQLKLEGADRRKIRNRTHRIKRLEKKLRPLKKELEDLTKTRKN